MKLAADGAGTASPEVPDRATVSATVGASPRASAATRPASSGPRRSASSLPRERGGALPFGVRLVVCFFAIDAVQTAWQLGHAVWQRWASAGGGVLSPPAFFDHHLPLLLALLFDVLLAAMIGFRTRAGRFWGIIYLVSLTGVGLTLLVLEPSRWLDLAVWGRAREVGTHMINLGLASILLSARSRRALQR